MENALPLLALCRDLMFASKITAAARAAGVAVKVVRDPLKVSEEKGGRLFLDLNQAGTIDAAVAWKAATGGVAVGFVSHVDGDRIRAARVAGIDRVMPRSEFDRLLPTLVRDESGPVTGGT